MWQTIDSVPIGKRVMLWWRPVALDKYPHPPEHASELSNNRYAECCVIGTISRHEPGKWWNGETYQDIWHVTHWQELPTAPYI